MGEKVMEAGNSHSCGISDSAVRNGNGKRTRSLWVLMQIRVGRWFSSRIQRRRDADMLASMSERDLHDIGLYNRAIPAAEAIVPESRSKSYIMMDGSQFPGSSGE